MASVAALSNQELDTLGVRIYHLEHVFLEEEVCTATDATGSPLKIQDFEIENLQRPPGVIRNKGADVVRPLDGNKGAANVHCLQGNDQVGEATHMLSYSWGCSLSHLWDAKSETIKSTACGVAG